MKYLIFSFIIFLFACSATKHTSSHENVDTLKKYSYLLALCTPKGNSCFLSGMSTGFFIKHGKTVYLVSAYHVLTQTNTTSDNPKTFIHKRAIVRLKNPSDDFLINLEQIREHAKKISVYNTPDVYFYKTNLDPNSVEINSIENLIENSRDKKGAKVEAISYGYLNNATDTTNIYTYQPIEYKGQILNPTEFSSYAYFQNIDSLHYIFRPKTYDGTSGSPVFFKYKKRKKEWVEFAGLMVATDSTTNTTVVLKKELIIKEFEKQTNSTIY